MTIIHTKEQLTDLIDKTLLVIPVMDSGIHYNEDDVILLFIYNIIDNKQYILNLTHQDIPSYTDDITSIINTGYCVDKKTLFTKKIVTDNVLDLNFMHYPVHHKKFNLSEFIPSHFLLHRNRFTSLDVYPLSILVQMCNAALTRLLSMINMNINFIDSMLMFDHLYYDTLFKTEFNGLVYEYDTIYSDYNPYTMTNRPTNSSYGINLSAVSKKDGSRKKIKPLDTNSGVFLQFDYSSFHVYLLAMMLGITLPKNSDVYIALNDIYKFSNSTERKNIKLDFFKFVYGSKEYNNTLSNKISIFVTELYDFFIKNGYVYSFFLKRKILFNVDKTIEKHKLFNYYLQNAETEYNLTKISKLNSTIPNNLFKIVLYVYDSFLIEINKNNNESASIANKILNILQEDGIPATVQFGYNYQDLVDIY